MTTYFWISFIKQEPETAAELLGAVFVPATTQGQAMASVELAKLNPGGSPLIRKFNDTDKRLGDYFRTPRFKNRWTMKLLSAIELEEFDKEVALYMKYHPDENDG